MIILIAGGTHSGKTALSQKLLEKLGYPYLSIDHLKMGLIRSGQTTLTPTSDESELTNYLWPIVAEMVKTAVENKQNMIIEGIYIPFDYADWFEPEYLEEISYFLLAFSSDYIRQHFDEISRFENVLESRQVPDLKMEELLVTNRINLEKVREKGLSVIETTDCFKLESMVTAVLEGLNSAFLQ